MTQDDIADSVKKGTTTVAIMCADGVVLAADKRATLGGRIVGHKKVDKVFQITDSIGLTMAGSVSDAQLIVKILKAELNLRRIRTGREPTVRETAALLGQIVYGNVRRFSVIPGITGFLLGGVDMRGFALYDIGIDGSVLGHDDYIADGSGFMMALGVLDTLYTKNMKVADGIKLSIKAVNAAMQRDTATGEGIDVFTVTKAGVKKVYHKQVEITL